MKIICGTKEVYTHTDEFLVNIDFLRTLGFTHEDIKNHDLIIQHRAGQITFECQQTIRKRLTREFALECTLSEYRAQIWLSSNDWHYGNAVRALKATDPKPCGEILTPFEVGWFDEQAKKDMALANKVVLPKGAVLDECQCQNGTAHCPVHGELYKHGQQIPIGWQALPIGVVTQDGDCYFSSFSKTWKTCYPVGLVVVKGDLRIREFYKLPETQYVDRPARIVTKFVQEFKVSEFGARFMLERHNWNYDAAGKEIPLLEERILHQLRCYDYGIIPDEAMKIIDGMVKGQFAWSYPPCGPYWWEVKTGDKRPSPAHADDRRSAQSCIS